IAARRLERYREDRVLDLLVVIGELDPHPLLEQPGIEPGLELLPHFGLEASISDILGRDGALPAGTDPRLIGLDRRKDVRLLSRSPPGSPQLELREPVLAGEEGLLG